MVVWLAVLTAASPLAAQDSMIVRSYRTIDLCTGQKRFTIAPYLGAISATDSLASFDITIGYNPATTRPTDLLTEGTLSANLDFKATMSLIEPGEIRVAGFNILRSLVGDLPVFAVAGTYDGDCGMEDTLGIPWPPEFNEEFKKRVNVFRTDTLRVVVNPQVRPDVGTSFDHDTVEIKGEGKTTEVENSILLGSTMESISFAFTLRNTDTTKVHIVGCVVENLQEPYTVSHDATQVTVSGRHFGATVPRVITTLRSVTGAEIASSSATSTLSILDSCTCIKPGLADSITVLCSNPMVSVSSSSDEHNDILVVRNNEAICQCDHEQMNEIRLYDVQYRLHRINAKSGGTSAKISFSDLPHGFYILVGQCGNRIQTLRKLK